MVQLAIQIFKNSTERHWKPPSLEGDDCTDKTVKETNLKTSKNISNNLFKTKTNEFKKLSVSEETPTSTRFSEAYRSLRHWVEDALVQDLTPTISSVLKSQEAASKSSASDRHKYSFSRESFGQSSRTSGFSAIQGRRTTRSRVRTLPCIFRLTNSNNKSLNWLESTTESTKDNNQSGPKVETEPAAIMNEYTKHATLYNDYVRNEPPNFICRQNSMSKTQGLKKTRSCDNLNSDRRKINNEYVDGTISILNKRTSSENLSNNSNIAFLSKISGSTKLDQSWSNKGLHFESAGDTKLENTTSRSKLEVESLSNKVTHQNPLFTSGLSKVRFGFEVEHSCGVSEQNQTKNFSIADRPKHSNQSLGSKRSNKNAILPYMPARDGNVLLPPKKIINYQDNIIDFGCEHSPARQDAGFETFYPQTRRPKPWFKDPSIESAYSQFLKEKRAKRLLLIGFLTIILNTLYDLPEWILAFTNSGNDEIKDKTSTYIFTPEITANEQDFAVNGMSESLAYVLLPLDALEVLFQLTVAFSGYLPALKDHTEESTVILMLLSISLSAVRPGALLLTMNKTHAEEMGNRDGLAHIQTFMTSTLMRCIMGTVLIDSICLIRRQKLMHFHRLLSFALLVMLIACTIGAVLHSLPVAFFVFEWTVGFATFVVIGACYAGAYMSELMHRRSFYSVSSISAKLERLQEEKKMGQHTGRNMLEQVIILLKNMDATIQSAQELAYSDPQIGKALTQISALEARCLSVLTSGKDVYKVNWLAPEVPEDVKEVYKKFIEPFVHQQHDALTGSMQRGTSRTISSYTFSPKNNNITPRSCMSCTLHEMANLGPPAAHDKFSCNSPFNIRPFIPEIGPCTAELINEDSLDFYSRNGQSLLKKHKQRGYPDSPQVISTQDVTLSLSGEQNLNDKTYPAIEYDANKPKITLEDEARMIGLHFLWDGAKNEFFSAAMKYINNECNLMIKMSEVESENTSTSVRLNSVEMTPLSIQSYQIGGTGENLRLSLYGDSAKFILNEGSPASGVRHLERLFWEQPGSGRLCTGGEDFIMKSLQGNLICFSKIGVVWDVDMFSLDKKTNGNSLVYTGMHLLLPHIHMEGIQCSPSSLLYFLMKLQNQYKPHLYHSHVHGAMVGHLAVTLTRLVGLSKPSSDKIFEIGKGNELSISGKRNFLRSRTMVKPSSPGGDEIPATGLRISSTCVNLNESSKSLSDEVVICLAALGHDVGHPGVNNAFLVATNQPVALVYNDNAVLENYHAYSTFKIIAEAGLKAGSILKGLSSESFREHRRRIIELILCTDMAQHFSTISALRTRCQSPNFSIEDDEDDKWLVAKMCLKVADLGHAALGWKSHFDWSCRVAEEFYQQGNLEHLAGLPISPLCDKSKQKNFPSSQSGFLEYIVTPLVTQILVTLETQEHRCSPEEHEQKTFQIPKSEKFKQTIIEPLLENQELWKSIQEQNP